ncbi:MAG TPA: ureidoglycolate lyase [Xanthomonadales bacterium]|nr:ureidoglycolate lyase [Xanthomonadales bacterium]
MLTLTPQPLTPEGFAPFGDVIAVSGNTAELINAGHTQKFTDLAGIDTTAEGGRTAVHIYRSQPLSLPLEIRVMERHPLGSQAFMPLHNGPFLVIVAPAGGELKSDEVQAFLSNGQQGVNLRRGTWHHFQVSLLQVSDYLVIDRMGPGINFEERSLSPPLLIDNLDQASFS